MIVIKSRQEEQASRKTYSSRTTLYNEEDRDRLVRIMPGVFVEADASMSAPSRAVFPSLCGRLGNGCRIFQTGVAALQEKALNHEWHETETDGFSSIFGALPH